jgi:branched-chain amino acid transport system substrate-binding protein
MKAAGVEAILNWSIEPAQAIAIKNVRQLGLTIPIFQSHGFGNIEYAKAAGAAAEGVLFPAGRLHVADQLPASHPQRPVLVSYRKAYESRFKEDASGFGGYAHDAFLILKSAIERAGGFDREKVRSAIETTKGLVGASGTFNFSPSDHNGLDIDAFEMLTVKNGHFTPVAK